MKKLFVYILILTAIASFAIPVSADIVCPENTTIGPDGNSCVPVAAPSTNYQFLSPLPGLDAEKGFDPTGEGGGQLGAYLNAMLKVFIGICAVLAVIMIIIGGLEYMTSELPGNKEHGKQRITGAVFGLILALGAWTILNEINPDLLKTDLSSLESVEVEVTLDDVPQTYDPVTKQYPNGQKFGDPWTGTPSVLVGVGVSPKGDCTTIGQPSCTSIKELNVSYLQTIKNNCPRCQLVVTGGTEFWLHGGSSGSTSHGKRSPTVDLRFDDNLTAYVKSGKKTTPNRWTKDGISFLLEADHWHAGP